MGVVAKKKTSKGGRAPFLKILNLILNLIQNDKQNDIRDYQIHLDWGRTRVYEPASLHR